MNIKWLSFSTIKRRWILRYGPVDQFDLVISPTNAYGRNESSLLLNLNYHHTMALNDQWSDNNANNPCKRIQYEHQNEIICGDAIINWKNRITNYCMYSINLGKSGVCTLLLCSPTFWCSRHLYLLEKIYAWIHSDASNEIQTWLM